MTIIKKYCEKCRKRIYFDRGFYLQIYERRNRSNRENAFLCNKCTKKLGEWFEEK